MFHFQNTYDKIFLYAHKQGYARIWVETRDKFLRQTQTKI